MSAATNRGSFHDGANSSMLSKKVVVVGNSGSSRIVFPKRVHAIGFFFANAGVGKTALVLRYVQDHFNGDLPATIGGSFLAKKMYAQFVGTSCQVAAA